MMKTNNNKLIIFFVIYGVAWLLLNDYWLCFFSGGVYLMGGYFLLKWRAITADDEDIEQYQQRNKNILIIYALFCGVISYKIAVWLIDIEQHNATTMCGILQKKYINRNQGRVNTSYIQLKTDESVIKIESNGYEIENFDKNDEICVKFIDKDNSLFLPKNYTYSIYKQN